MLLNCAWFFTQCDVCLLIVTNVLVILCKWLYVFPGNVSVPDGMAFTVNFDLNGDSPQFTLTCTSTGGPATTVTWTRDSETVSGGMTVLDDPVTAQYTHTLTVTGRLGGQYQCNVSNNKPSTDTAQLTVEGTIYFPSRK